MHTSPRSLPGRRRRSRSAVVFLLLGGSRSRPRRRRRRFSRPCRGGASRRRELCNSFCSPLRVILTNTVQQRVQSLALQRRGSTGRTQRSRRRPSPALLRALVSLRFFEFVWVSERVFAAGPGRVAMDPMLLEDVNVVSLWKTHSTLADIGTSQAAPKCAVQKRP